MIDEELRIHWKIGEKAAKVDCATLNAWVNWQIDTDTAIQYLSHNNEIVITRKQFEANVKELGYIRNGY